MHFLPYMIYFWYDFSLYYIPKDKAEMSKNYTTFEEFYPYYLSEHSNITNRRLHVIGTSLALLQIIRSLVMVQLWGLLLAVVIGYGCAWVGHFFFEKNKPATFKYPLFSLRGDFVMMKDVLTGKIKFWFQIPQLFDKINRIWKKFISWWPSWKNVIFNWKKIQKVFKISRVGLNFLQAQIIEW